MMTIQELAQELFWMHVLQGALTTLIGAMLAAAIDDLKKTIVKKGRRHD